MDTCPLIFTLNYTCYQPLKNSGKMSMGTKMKKGFFSCRSRMSTKPLVPMSLLLQIDVALIKMNA